MKNVYYVQTAWEGRKLDRAVGETGALGRPEPRFEAVGADKVIDLAAWKAENLVEPVEDTFEEPESGLASYAGRELVRRPRRRWDALARGELAATLSVAGVMLAMVVRVLVF